MSATAAERRRGMRTGAGSAVRHVKFFGHVGSGKLEYRGLQDKATRRCSILYCEIPLIIQPLTKAGYPSKPSRRQRRREQ